MQLDHIIALANGGNHNLSNIQVLCVACHGDTTKQEKTNGYVNIAPTKSSLNSIVNIYLIVSYVLIMHLWKDLTTKFLKN